MFESKLNEVTLPRKRFIADPFNFISLGVALLINIIHWAVLYFKIRVSNGTILIHYNVVYGPDFVEKARYVYLIPFTVLILLVINAGLAMYFYKKEKLAAYFLNFSNIPVQIIFLVASLTIIAING